MPQPSGEGESLGSVVAVGWTPPFCLVTEEAADEGALRHARAPEGAAVALPLCLFQPQPFIRSGRCIPWMSSRGAWTREPLAMLQIV